MGSFIYDRAAEFEIDDRSLAHLQVVILNKLRRRESFALDLGDGTTVETVWINESTPLEFRYAGNRQPLLNQLWLESMAGEAGLNGLLRITPEPRTPDT
jgi:hypothetical protein